MKFFPVDSSNYVRLSARNKKGNPNGLPFLFLADEKKPLNVAFLGLEVSKDFRFENLAEPAFVRGTSGARPAERSPVIGIEN